MPPPEKDLAYWRELAIKRGQVICKLQRLLSERPGPEAYRWRDIAESRMGVIRRLQRLITEANTPRRK